MADTGTLILPDPESRPRPEPLLPNASGRPSASLFASSASVGSVSENRFLLCSVASLRANQLRRGALARVPLAFHSAANTALAEVRSGLIPYRTGIDEPTGLQISASGEQVSSFALVQGGIGVSVSKVEELEAVEALVTQGLESAYRELASGRVSGWRQWQDPSGASAYAWEGLRGFAEASGRQTADSLVAAVALARRLWLQCGREATDLEAFVALSSPVEETASAPDRLHVRTKQPALFLHPGTIAATIGIALARPVGWIVALTLKRGVGAATSAHALVQRLRQRATELSSLDPPLPDLRVVTTKWANQFTGLIVCVHGLLSTDTLTFDRLVQRLRAALPKVLVVGFPHNTLTSIENTALELQGELRRLFSSAKAARRIPVVLVCHSRGGLVARQLSVLLRDGHEMRWEDVLKGCVTFGSPHHGAPLADAPASLVGTWLSLGAAVTARSIATVRDVLTYIASGGQLDGVTDLRMMEGAGPAAGRFLTTLATAENRLGIGPFWTIGGVTSAHGRLGYLVRHVFAEGVSNDAVVAYDSSTWRTQSVERRKTRCDHFGYFGDSEDEVLARVTDQVAAWLR